MTQSFSVDLKRNCIVKVSPEVAEGVESLEDLATAFSASFVKTDSMLNSENPLVHDVLLQKSLREEYEKCIQEMEVFGVEKATVKLPSVSIPLSLNDDFDTFRLNYFDSIATLDRFNSKIKIDKIEFSDIDEAAVAAYEALDYYSAVNPHSKWTVSLSMSAAEAGCGLLQVFEKDNTFEFRQGKSVKDIAQEIYDNRLRTASKVYVPNSRKVVLS